MRRLLRWLAAFAVLAAGLSGQALAQQPHVRASLVAQDAGAAPGGVTYVAIRQDIEKGWHTYWRNPGRAGAATAVKWTLPAGWTAGDIVWPTPTRLVEGEPPNSLAVYAYEGEALLPVPITAPAGARPGETASIRADVTFLVCAEQCVPEDATLFLDLPISAARPAPDPKWGEAVAGALTAAPKPAGLSAVFTAAGDRLQLAVTGAPLAGADMAGAYFFPFDALALDMDAEQTIERGPQGLTLSVPAGYAFKQGQAPGAIAGVLALRGQAYEVIAEPGAIPAEAGGLGPPPSATGGGLGLPMAVLFALLGGLILNLMPCVFPVLSMKAAALAGHAHQPREARSQGLAFAAGVLATFLVLAAALIAGKAAGAAIGWGFQLQTPGVVGALALLMLLVALNLFGVFEVGTSVQGAGSGLAGRGGLAGAFLTGVLAVVVAAPCTAPFMAPALGYALVRSPPEALAVLAALAIGFAAPFTALAFAPGLLRRLPRPGPWMALLRRVLAFPMFGAAAWLAWVLAQQAGTMGLARLFAAALVAAFGAWLFGLGQRGGRRVLEAVGAFVALAGAVVAALPYAAAPATATAGSRGVEAQSEPFSPERLAALRAEGRPVFVNFTAAWCVTCQVNEGAALGTGGLAEALRRTGAVYLKADWTRRDATIAAVLAEHGRAGVPLYLVYAPGTAEPVVLPQFLTEGMVVKALYEAAGPTPDILSHAKKN